MGAVAVYDLSREAGWAVWKDGMPDPRYGVLKLPPPMSNGSVGPALALLFEHISWVNRTYGPLEMLGFEAFIAPTGGRKDKETSFVTSPKTIKCLVGFVGVAELAAHLLDIEAVSIHNMSWRRTWLGKQKRGTKRDDWKALSVQKAMRVGWAPLGDNDADALGQLHHLLITNGFKVPWQSRVDQADFKLGFS